MADMEKVEDIPLEALEVLEKLRDSGYVVVVMSPKELKGADPDQVADIITQRGYGAIEYLQTE